MGVVPDVRLGREGPGGSQRPSSELGGGVWLGPPASPGLVRPEGVEAGLPRLSGAPEGSKLRLGTSERSRIRNDKACLYHLLCSQFKAVLGLKGLWLSPLPDATHLPGGPLQLLPTMPSLICYDGQATPMHFWLLPLLPLSLSLDSSAHSPGSTQMLPRQDAFLNHSPVPTGHAPSLP